MLLYTHRFVENTALGLSSLLQGSLGQRERKAAAGRCQYLMERRGGHPRAVPGCPWAEGDLSTETNTLDVAPYLIPHDNKRKTGGEDTYMISSDGQVLGVFDGVGGWAEDGVDPRDYPVALRDGCKLIAETVGPSLDPLNILRYGYRQSMSIMGSSTACIVTISNNVLLAANLGDSGLRVLRKGQVVLASAPQQHRFNTPFQLGPDSADTPEDAELLQFTLKDHDTIVLASDGLYDNLFDSEIAATVSRAGAAHGSAATLACALARGAYRRSKEACADNPFNAEARRYGLGFKDGKQDDITVLVAVYHGGEDDW